MEVDPVELQKVQLVFGKEFNSDDFRDMQMRMRIKRSTPSIEASRLTRVTLPNELRAGTETGTEAGLIDYKLTGFKDVVAEVVATALKGIDPVSSISAYKWCEKMNDVFKEFEFSKDIITTIGYEKAD